MVSVADEEGHLVLMGVDATYCVVDEVDTTTTTMNDQFLHQAIEDAQTSVKQEPVGPDSEEEQDSLMQTDTKPPIQTSQQSLLADQTAPSHPQSPLPILPENIKTEIVQEDVDTASAQMDTTTNAEKALSNSSILRAALQRQPISLREPETADSSHQQQSASSDLQNVESIDSTAGKALVPPVLKRKTKQNSPSKSPASGSEASGEKSEGETEGEKKEGDTGGEKKAGDTGGEKKEGEDKGKGESSKRKRSRDKPYQCGVCQRWFGCKSHVVEHMRTHTGEKPFECTVCHKRFSQKSNIHQHMNTHTQQRPFRCSDCGKDFMYRGSLYKHKRLHTGERPYTCGLCDRRFTHASQLFEHLRTHTNERPFKCGVCGRAFSHSGTMHRHQRGHFNGGRTKTPVVEVDREKEGAVSDINHNTPAYKSRMETPPAEAAGTSVRVVDCSQPGLKQSSRESKSSSVKKITKIVIGKGLSLSPYFVSDVSGKGQRIIPAGKTTPGQQGSSDEGDVRREELTSSPSAQGQAATTVLGEKKSGNIETSSVAPSGKKTEKESSPPAISGEKWPSPILVSAGTQSSPQKQAPGRSSAKKPSPKSTSRKRKSGGRSAQLGTAGVRSAAASSPALPFSQLFVVSSASSSSHTDVASFSQSAFPSHRAAADGAGSASLPHQASTVCGGSSEAVSQFAVLSAVPIETGDNRSVVKMEVQDPTQNKTVTLLLTSSLPSPPGVPKASSPPPPKPLAPKPPPPSTAKKSSAKRASPEPSEEAQKKKRTRLETPDLKVFSCDICGRSFCHRRSVKRHKLASHPEWDPYSEGKSGEEEVGEGGNRDKGVQVKVTSGQQKDGGDNHINTKLLKSLLTLTAENNKPTSSHPQFTVKENRPMGTTQGATQPVEMQEENQPMGMQRDTPPMELEGDAQPMKSQDLGEASASLQAIAHLCVQGQTPDVNQNTLMTLEKEVKDHSSWDVAERRRPKKSVEKNGSDAAELNQNLSSCQGSTEDTVCSPTRSHSMPKIAFKASRAEPTPTPHHHNQKRGQESDLPSGHCIANVVDKGDTDRSVLAENSSSRGKESSSLENLGAEDSVVVKLEPVDDMELD